MCCYTSWGGPQIKSEKRGADSLPRRETKKYSDSEHYFFSGVFCGFWSSDYKYRKNHLIKLSNHLMDIKMVKYRS